jgi:hypothetical protein
MILSFSTCLDAAFFGIITSIASDQRFGQYPVRAGIDTMAASTCAIFSSSAPVMISDNEGPKVLTAVCTFIFSSS